MTATAFVEPDSDALIVDVTGANPNKQQTALLKLWAPRSAACGGSGSGGPAFAKHGWITRIRVHRDARLVRFRQSLREGREVSAAVY